MKEQVVDALNLQLDNLSIENTSRFTKFEILDNTIDNDVNMEIDSESFNLSYDKFISTISVLLQKLSFYEHSVTWLDINEIIIGTEIDIIYSCLGKARKPHFSTTSSNIRYRLLNYICTQIQAERMYLHNSGSGERSKLISNISKLGFQVEKICNDLEIDMPSGACHENETGLTGRIVDNKLSIGLEKDFNISNQGEEILSNEGLNLTSIVGMIMYKINNILENYQSSIGSMEVVSTETSFREKNLELIRNPPKILNNIVLTKEQTEKILKIEEVFNADFIIRRRMLLKRLDVTIQSFLWGKQAQGKESEIASAVNSQRVFLTEVPTRYSIADALEVPISLLYDFSKRVTEHSSKKSIVKRIIIGSVPDRGGRADSMRPKSSDFGGYQGRGSGGGGGHRGGGGHQGGGGRGNGHNKGGAGNGDKKGGSKNWHKSNNNNNNNNNNDGNKNKGKPASVAKP